MLDPLIRRLIDPPLTLLATRLPWRANVVSLFGFGLGLGAALAVALGQPLWALALFLLNRLGDGLDGALARQQGSTDRGGFLDIVLDFTVYGLLGFAFAWAKPADALAAAFLLASFMATASSFLGYAIIAAKRGVQTEARGRKSFFHLGGLAEGGETILFFVLCMVFPGWFVPMAWAFGALCWMTAAGRLLAAWRDFPD